MNNKGYIISFRPQQHQVEQLQAWMRAENELDNGLHHYTEELKKYFEGGTLGVIEQNGEAIGFISWTIYKRIGYIANAAIMLNYRRRGIGKLLIEAFFTHASATGLLALYLLCAPAESQKFWKQMDFKDMPLIPGYSDKGSPSLFRCLVPVQDEEQPGENSIAIDYGEDPELNYWPVVFKDGSNVLLKPIIVPAHGDWEVTWKNKGVDNQPDKIKYFRRGVHFESPFFIVVEL